MARTDSSSRTRVKSFNENLRTTSLREATDIRETAIGRATADSNANNSHSLSLCFHSLGNVLFARR
jgi:hypothetical protein